MSVNYNSYFSYHHSSMERILWSSFLIWMSLREVRDFPESQHEMQQVQMVPLINCISSCRPTKFPCYSWYIVFSHPNIYITRYWNESKCHFFLYFFINANILWETGILLHSMKLFISTQHHSRQLTEKQRLKEHTYLLFHF